jgi:hypothetical protein
VRRASSRRHQGTGDTYLLYHTHGKGVGREDRSRLG